MSSRRKERHQHHRQARSAGTSAEEPTSSEMKMILDQRERDLEVAARLGNSLLEQNKELQEKNEFLEESLSNSNDAIAQLKRQLKQRSDLFRAIVGLEDEQDADEKTEDDLRQSNLGKLERKIKQLESENAELRTKGKQLEELKAIVERREEHRVSEYISQLRAANLKVAQLHVQLNEKGRQCGAQAEEVQKLMREIAQKKNREKLLWEENDDLNSRLEEATASHEQLVQEMGQLQEQHFDLIAALRETEEEVRVFREKEANAMPAPRRSNSTDSLYDSLASELEGADSGCYNTPMFSARYGPSPHLSSLSNNGNEQPCCSTSIPENSPSMESEQTTAERSSSASLANQIEAVGGAQAFDVPSRALMEAVRTTFGDRKHFRRLSPSRLLSRQQNVLSELKSEEEEADFDEGETPVVERVQCLKEEGVQCELEAGRSAQVLQQQQIVGTPPGTGKLFKDASCSPILFSEDRDSGGEQQQEEQGCSFQFPTTPTQTPRQTVPLPSPSTRSVDSFEGYSPPKLGAPGRPGTRDLDFSIKRLNLRKEIDSRYQRFREHKGLPPAKSGFYGSDQMQPAIFSSLSHSMNPSEQLKRLSSDRFQPSNLQFPVKPILALSRTAIQNSHISAVLNGRVCHPNSGIHTISDLISLSKSGSCSHLDDAVRILSSCPTGSKGNSIANASPPETTNTVPPLVAIPPVVVSSTAAERSRPSLMGLVDKSVAGGLNSMHIASTLSQCGSVELGIGNLVCPSATSPSASSVPPITSGVLQRSGQLNLFN